MRQPPRREKREEPLSQATARWVLSATLVAESVWVYSAIAVAGLAMELQGGAPAWPVVAAVMGISMAIVHAAPSESDWAGRIYKYRALIGVAALYLAVASQLATTTFGLDLLWAARVVIGDTPQGYGISAAVSVVAGALLWWRGGALASADRPKPKG